MSKFADTYDKKRLDEPCNEIVFFCVRSNTTRGTKLDGRVDINDDLSEHVVIFDCRLKTNVCVPPSPVPHLHHADLLTTDMMVGGWAFMDGLLVTALSGMNRSYRE